MVNRIFGASLALAVAVLFSQAPVAHAATVVGSQSLSFAGAVSNTGDINTATSFTLVGLNAPVTIFMGTNISQTGDFATYVTTPATFGDTTLNTTTGLSFSDTGFGTFTGTQVLVQPTGNSTQAFDIIGLFTPGTDFHGMFAPADAELAVSFTQVGGAGSAISASATFYSPVFSVPEPGSIVMGLFGLGFCGAMYRSRRRSAKVVA